METGTYHLGVATVLTEKYHFLLLIQKSRKAQKHFKKKTILNISLEKRNFRYGTQLLQHLLCQLVGYANMLEIVSGRRCLDSWVAAWEDPTWWRLGICKTVGISWSFSSFFID